MFQQDFIKIHMLNIKVNSYKSTKAKLPLQQIIIKSSFTTFHNAF